MDKGSMVKYSSTQPAVTSSSHFPYQALCRSPPRLLCDSPTQLGFIPNSALRRFPTWEKRRKGKGRGGEGREEDRE